MLRFVSRRVSVARPLVLAGLLALAASPALAGPTVNFTLPGENTTPSVFGSLPYPSDLYFDQGGPTDGDGTLINNGASWGLSADVVRNTNYTATLERGLDALDGFGVTSGCFFFFNGSIDVSSLPASPRVAPSASDSVFLMNLSDGSLVPIALKADIDTRIPNTLAVIPLPGHPLAPQTQYACVVDGGAGGVTGAATPVVPSADFIAARTGTSGNTDANDIYVTAATYVSTHSGPAIADIAGMAVFTTQSTLEALKKVQTVVLPGLPMPTADLSDPTLVFEDGTANDLEALFGPTPHANLSIVATGYFNSPRFQTNDPNGNKFNEDFPNLSSLGQPCSTACEPADERFVYTSPTDKAPIVQDPNVMIPFTVTIPAAAAPGSGYPIVIDQHGLGGDRKTAVDLADSFAEGGFASIGIDAVAHGYRFVDPKGTRVFGLLPDVANNFGGTAVPDGFADATILGYPIGGLSTQLGFFQGFSNIIGAGDNFRQTCADLMQLVRLIQSNSIDGTLGVNIDENKIFYIGHSLGGIMGSCLAAFEPDIKAYVVNAPGGGLIAQLLLSSSIGAGAIGSFNTIFGLAPSNVLDQFSFFGNMAQNLVDNADPAVESTAWIQNPIVGGPRNIIQISDDSDEVVPNQANEALGHAAGLEIFDPFVKNLFLHPEPLPVATNAGGSIGGNGPGGVTAFYLQQGPATHAATITPFAGRLTYVPGHAVVSEWPDAFPGYDRGIRIQNSYVLPSLIAWFQTIAAGSAAGTFTFAATPNYNPIESINVSSGPSSHTFFARTVNAGGTSSYSEPTSDVTVNLTSNGAAGRLSAGRSVLGTTALAANDDMPPGIGLLASGALPFFVNVQKKPMGSLSADLTIAYTPDDLLRAGLVDGSADETGLQIARVGGPGTCLVGAAACANSAACGSNGPCVELLPTTVNAAANEVTTTGLAQFSIFAVVNPGLYGAPLLIPGPGSGTSECAIEFALSNPAGAAVVDKNGNPAFKQSCTDGDPSCDFDNVAGQCTFQAALCVNNVDPRLPSCSTKSLTALVVKTPSEKDALNPGKPGDDANRAALLGAVDADGPITIPDNRSNDCAAFNLVVVQKTGSDGPKKTTKKVKVQGTFVQQPPGSEAKLKKETDQLQLTCYPSP